MIYEILFGLGVLALLAWGAVGARQAYGEWRAFREDVALARRLQADREHMASMFSKEERNESDQQGRHGESV